MSSSRPVRPGIVGLLAPLAFLAPVALVGACSSADERAPFVDDSGVIPAEPPRNPQAVDAQPGPGPIESDASAEPDAPDTCNRTAPSKTCGLVPQCGCTLAETCDVEDSSGNVGCVTAGKAVMGAACVATAGCRLGLTCVFGTCHAFCNTPGTACAQLASGPKVGSCLQVRDQDGAAMPNLAVCRVACDLREAAACGAPSGAGTGVCVVDDTGVTDCVKAGPVLRAAGQTCGPTDDCAPTTVCAGTGGANTCKKWCRVGLKDCGGTTVCSGFQTKIIVGGVEHGVCP